GVVVEGIQAAASHTADRPPTQIAEINDQVRRDAVHLAVQLLGSIGARTDVAPVRVFNRRDGGNQLGAYALVVGRRDDPLRLAPPDVQEETPVIAAVPPSTRGAPINQFRTDRRDLL